MTHFTLHPTATQALKTLYPEPSDICFSYMKTDIHYLTVYVPSINHWIEDSGINLETTMNEFWKKCQTEDCLTRNDLVEIAAHLNKLPNTNQLPSAT